MFGRFIGQWRLQSLPASGLREFFPAWSAKERVVLYAMMGGVPAYLCWLNGDLNLVDNIRQVILAPGNIFLVEPEPLLYDELRDLSTYQIILRAVSKGCHTLQAISDDCLMAVFAYYRMVIADSHLVSYILGVCVRKASLYRLYDDGRLHSQREFHYPS